MDKIFNKKITDEIERIAKKYGGNNCVVEYNLEHELNKLSLLILVEYRSATDSTERTYELPDELVHG